MPTTSPVQVIKIINYTYGRWQDFTWFGNVPMSTKGTFTSYSIFFDLFQHGVKVTRYIVSINLLFLSPMKALIEMTKILSNHKPIQFRKPIHET